MSHTQRRIKYTLHATKTSIVKWLDYKHCNILREYILT